MAFGRIVSPKRLRRLAFALFINEEANGKQGYVFLVFPVGSVKAELGWRYYLRDTYR